MYGECLAMISVALLTYDQHNGTHLYKHGIVILLVTLLIESPELNYLPDKRYPERRGWVKREHHLIKKVQYIADWGFDHPTLY